MSVWRELCEWWTKRKKLTWNKRNRMTASLNVIGLLALRISWRSTVKAPALLQVKQRLAFCVPYPAQVKTLHVNEGQDVKTGNILIEAISPDLDHKLLQAGLNAKKIT
ncbi:MAG: biotin/lipoyl-binding protein [Rhodospirillales bacterium]|jgi:putative peptide zinc metalloprotease protein